MDECWPCMKKRYYLVLYDTHLAQFSVKTCASKQEMMKSYQAAFHAVLQTDARSCVDN